MISSTRSSASLNAALKVSRLSPTIDLRTTSMPSLFSSSVRKSELVSTRSGVSSSEPTAIISAFILRKSRESLDALPFFGGDHTARKLFEVSVQECSRKVSQVIRKPFERTATRPGRSRFERETIWKHHRIKHVVSFSQNLGRWHLHVSPYERQAADVPVERKERS